MRRAVPSPAAAAPARCGVVWCGRLSQSCVTPPPVEGSLLSPACAFSSSSSSLGMWGRQGGAAAGAPMGCSSASGGSRFGWSWLGRLGQPAGRAVSLMSSSTDARREAAKEIYAKDGCAGGWRTGGGLATWPLGVTNASVR